MLAGMEMNEKQLNLFNSIEKLLKIFKGSIYVLDARSNADVSVMSKGNIISLSLFVVILKFLY